MCLYVVGRVCVLFLFVLASVLCCIFFFFVKQKTAYYFRISDWSSDVCSSDLMGWVLGRFGFAASPIVLGLIRGAIAEQGFVQGWTIGAAVGDLPGMFFGRPISLAIIALTLLSLLYPLLRGRIFGRRGAAGGEGANVD